MIVHQYYYRDTRVRRYADALADAGAQVDVICVRPPSQLSMNHNSNVRVFTIPLGRGYGSRGSYLLEYGLAFLLFTAWLLALHMKHRYQVIHIHNMPDFLIFTALVPRLMGAKLILDIHDPMPELYMSKYRQSPTGIMVRLMQLQEKASTMFAHALITVNSSVKESLVERSIPGDKITVVSNLPDRRVFDRARYRKERRTQNEYFTLLYPGTIAPRYGLDVAIRALPSLVERIPRLRLVIIGPQVEYVNELAALAERLGVSTFVQFKPAIPVDQVPRQIIRADVGIYMALPDPYIRLVTPTKVMEYVVMGIPVIASRLKVLEELFTGSALMFFEPGDEEQFASCVFDLYEDPLRRDELVNNADDRFVRTHTWDNERRKYFDLLSRVLTR